MAGNPAGAAAGAAVAGASRRTSAATAMATGVSRSEREDGFIQDLSCSGWRSRRRRLPRSPGGASRPGQGLLGGPGARILRPMRSRIIAAMAAISIGGAALWVFRGSLGLFFAQEDFRGLAVAKGLLPRHEILWRYVSVQSFMDLFYPILGDEPRGYHWVSLGLHGANAMALFVLLHRRLSLAASFVAATFFAAHSTLFTAMYWLSARSDILATAFSLCTIGLALRRDRWRWLALVSHTCALLSEESVILLPAVVWLVRDWASMDRSRSHDRLMLSLGAVSIGFAFYLLAGRAGIGIGTGPSAPYAIDFAGSLVHNLLTYVGWVVDVAMKPSPLRFLDVQDPDVYGMALGGLAVWGIGCLVPGLRARGWVVAGAG